MWLQGFDADLPYFTIGNLNTLIVKKSNVGIGRIRAKFQSWVLLKPVYSHDYSTVSFVVF